MDDIFAIQILKARYFRAIDTKDWDLLTSVLTEDVAIDVTDDVPGGHPYTGRQQFVDTCAKVLDDAVTVHHGHMPELDLVDDTSATKFTACVAWTSFEMSSSGAARYRAGIAFEDADPLAVEAFLLRHKA